MQKISLITINLDNNANLKNIQFCYKLINLINPEKQYVLEKYIIFISKFQLNLITKCHQIFIEGTFKMTPFRYIRY